MVREMMTVGLWGTGGVEEWRSYMGKMGIETSLLPTTGARERSEETTLIPFLEFLSFTSTALRAGAILGLSYDISFGDDTLSVSSAYWVGLLVGLGGHDWAGTIGRERAYFYGVFFNFLSFCCFFLHFLLFSTF